MSERLVQLGSLRQLTLGSFLLALIPLIALLWQSQSDLAKVGKMTTLETRFVVDVVSDMQRLDNAVVDVERSVRQFAVLRNEQVASLSDNAIEQFAVAADNLCQALSIPTTCSRLSEQLSQLAEYRTIEDQLLLNAYLASVGDSVELLRDDVEATINERVKLQQDDLNAMQAKQAWSTAMLVSVSLLLILLGSQLIVNPVNNLKKIIRIMARSDGQLPPLSRQAPRELIDVEKDLHWLYDRLQQLEHIRTALLRHAAHELKTPLASIKEGCSLLSENVVGELNKGQREVLSLLTASTQRLNTLVEKLLDYNLLLQQAQPKMVVSDANKLVSACLEDYALAIQDREVDVNITSPEVKIDEELFRRVLDNLVSNAVAHGAVGRPINIHLYNENDNLVLDVANRGKRIAPESVHTLFEPFIRGTEPRNDNVIGTGLGLSIVADCARLMHGDVRVVDVDYADVCFRVTIPQQEK
ncbi:two-component sensor histidine kinase [Alteromonas mediterranea]|uniref:histidine kinase n=2 Tax=Alteromonas mediterranea TaxID=314275 RepID=A0AAC9J8T1_9ALTE|nr:HAMP domain-containing sensor histidine kinase [Alteromonas mediterranea]AGP93035.1 two-component system sensor kinase [Alteromonas mediterranea U8]MBR9895585.1 HAMP domain-containing histidine kinase [Gammaproteobacteria bacterium]AGP85031.1 two-component system sensor kinase [Alteromonas mediterranea U4]AGP89162.1 two-component system sensor kinase [Alteromonas mediterranea U7]AGV53663.1 ATPase [Alteromonas mediterranea DE]